MATSKKKNEKKKKKNIYNKLGKQKKGNWI